MFEKTMRWLHSAGEVEVPDGFFPGILEKMEEQKSKGLMSERARRRWFDKVLSLKLPIQAVAMVAIVFLVLYLTKMMPMEKYSLKDSNQTPSSLSIDKKSEPFLEQKEVERRSSALEATPEASQIEKVRQAKAPTLKEKKAEIAHVTEMKEEAKKGVSSPPKAEIKGNQAINLKETAMARAPSPGVEKFEKELTRKEKSVGDLKSPREIILAVSDHEKTLSKLNELVKQSGGEIITSEKNVYLVSLPIRFFSEFERELKTLSSSEKSNEITPQKRALDNLSFSSGVKEGEMRESGSSMRSIPEKDNYIVVRIIVLEE
jgi:hypothetical protein